MSTAPRQWLLLALMVVVALSAMAWLTARVLALAGEEERGRERSWQDQAVRRALWRLDSTMAPLLVAASDSASGADHKVPQLLPMAERLLIDLQGPSNDDSALAVAARDAEASFERQLPRAQHVQQAAFPDLQQGSFDFQARRQNLDNAIFFNGSMAARAQVQVQNGPLRAAWLLDRLALLSRIRGADGDRLQVMLVDWNELTKRLKALIGDLLPEARFRHLEAADADAVDPSGYALATLPVALQPGPAARLGAQDGVAGGTIRLTLATAWSCVLAAIAVLGALTVQAVALSERRATFVSAVTHELRTPITSLRLYADMLSSGMAEDPQVRAEYLATIRAEAERLGTLVENVLAFARLERAPVISIGALALGDLLAGCRGALERRARDAGMELAVTVEAMAQRPVLAVTGMVERILYNLVDNACKYAGSAGDRRIEIGAAASAGRVGVVVRDHGPGIDAAMRARLFTPFSRSAAEAAGNAPGVGLGLALSRSLARSLGGDLCCADGAGGACFILWLRSAG